MDDEIFAIISELIEDEILHSTHGVCLTPKLIEIIEKEY